MALQQVYMGKESDTECGGLGNGEYQPKLYFSLPRSDQVIYIHYNSADFFHA